MGPIYYDPCHWSQKRRINLTMATEAGKHDLNLQSARKAMSRTTRSSLFLLVAIGFLSCSVVFISPILSDLLDIVEETETKSTVQQSGSAREAFHRVQLTREEQRGSWIGNSWVPPPPDGSPTPRLN
jgi:hypothetical protein